MWNNDANEVPIEVYYNPADKLVAFKKEMIKDSSDFKKFRVSENLWENTMQEFFSWLRFVEFDDDPVILVDW